MHCAMLLKLLVIVMRRTTEKSAGLSNWGIARDLIATCMAPSCLPWVGTAS